MVFLLFFFISMMKKTFAQLICSELLYFLLSFHAFNLGGVVFGKYISKNGFGTERTIDDFSLENIDLE